MIPEMTDPLGKHWEQPRNIRDAPMDDDHVLLSLHQLLTLHEYSATRPTGVYPGKCWKRFDDGTWYLMWYGEHADPALCTINHRQILVIEEK